MNELIKELAKAKLEQIAKDIIDVQPMPHRAMKTLIESSSSEEVLIENGYRPVSRIGLLWIKE